MIRRGGELLGGEFAHSDLGVGGEVLVCVDVAGKDDGLGRGKLRCREWVKERRGSTCWTCGLEGTCMCGRMPEGEEEKRGIGRRGRRRVLGFHPWLVEGRSTGHAANTSFMGIRLEFAVAPTFKPYSPNCRDHVSVFAGRMRSR